MPHSIKVCILPRDNDHALIGMLRAQANAEGRRIPNRRGIGKRKCGKRQPGIRQTASPLGGRNP
jgi:hypothetical protein